MSAAEPTGGRARDSRSRDDKRSGKRLGKGLGALLGDYLGEAAAAEVAGTAAQGQPEARRLRIADIRPNAFQPRREFSEQELADLAASLEANGLLQPIVVRPAEGSGARWERSEERRVGKEWRARRRRE